MNELTRKVSDMSTQISFIEAIRTESDEYLRKYLKNKRTDSITMMHKNLIRNELARRARLAKRRVS